MEKKRNRLKVIYDILKVIKEKNGRIKPTHVLYKSNLSYHMMNEYILELIEKGFITEKKGKKGRTYFITEKGLNYIDKYNLVVDFTNSFGLG